MPDASAQFAALIGRMTQSICSGEPEAAAACFTENGVYHDGFYGEFQGRAAIADMVRTHFYGDAKDFTWVLSDAVSDGRIGYASYLFSYTATMPGAEGPELITGAPFGPENSIITITLTLIIFTVFYFVAWKNDRLTAPF